MTTQAARTEVACSRSFLLQSSALIMCVKKLFYCMSNMFDKCSHQLDFLLFLGLVSPPLPPLPSLSPRGLVSFPHSPPGGRCPRGRTLSVECSSRISFHCGFSIYPSRLARAGFQFTNTHRRHLARPAVTLRGPSHRVTPHRSRRLGVNRPLLPSSSSTGRVGTGL